MKRVDSNTAWMMFGLWLASLALLASQYFITSPDMLNTWLPMLRRPVAMIVVPLLVGCIPLIETIQSGMLRKMVRVWVVSLIVFAAPHPRCSFFDPILHQTTFLIFAPLLIALISLIVPKKWITLSVSPKPAEKSRAELWFLIFLCFVCAVFSIMMLLAINDPSTSHTRGGIAGLDAFVLLLLATMVYGIWKWITMLRNRN